MKAASIAVARRPRLFPREHGAYVVLLASWLVGVMSAQMLDAASVTLSLAVFLALFIAQEPLKHVLRGLKRNEPLDDHDVSRLFSLMLFGVSGFALLSRVHSTLLWTLLPGAACALSGLWLNHRRASMFAQSLAGFAALTLAGPALLLIGSPHSADANISQAAALWGELTLFFWASAMIVNVRIDIRSERSTRLVLGAFLLLAIILTSLNVFSYAALVSLGLLVARYVWVITDLDRYKRLSLKKIGIIETITAVVMVVLYAIL